MRYLIIILLFILFSCNEENIKQHSYSWRWNIEANPVIQCAGFDQDPETADIIIIKVKSDLGEIHQINEFIIFEESIIITAPEYMRDEDFNNPEFERLKIKLICYN
jgi:hypothetical protein